MSLDAKKEKSVETAAAVVLINKNKRYEKEKPWDNDPTLDKWVVEEFKPEHNPNGMIDESSFSCLFP